MKVVVSFSAVTVAMSFGGLHGISSTKPSSTGSGVIGGECRAEHVMHFAEDGRHDLLQRRHPRRGALGPPARLHRSRHRRRVGLFTRTLVQSGTGAGSSSNAIHPDLATNLGVSSNNNKTWKFTLKTGIKWQDGTPVTCANVAYGVSRTFAQDIITGDRTTPSSS